ncbi:DUF2913 family protein [Edwardsiella anguillarum]|uniref:DUF2913 family protein n=1 Tax=Edwardsiella anguillarum TaxID=1821960 RepID=A0ABY8SKT2_9GAMM|nr:DUF2913 family protein [Edwardsiella anguillarum]WHP85912.1 DUF2913 family protein [Edwardsiella anguillarum]WHP89682.1 DUF2913 family protein [Edwardsiella anguillarum]WHP93480.1 DUF2913 family protein [Edwardsiella anguillarum]WHP97305.1 DUF2913 family protein [Edwardsiella anguillarum]WHP97330.1 DUF2913 family protein [Edwardsiella anguillarum]
MQQTLPPQPDGLTHLAWCLLVAVRLAECDGKITTPLQTHLFIMRWLATAQKRKIFSKAQAPDILLLQAQGKKYGSSAKLRQKVEYIYCSGAGQLAEQSDLFRLTYLVETMKGMGWLNALVSDAEWDSLVLENANHAIYLRKSQLQESFDEAQRQIAPMVLRLCGEQASGVLALCKQCHVRIAPPVQQAGFLEITLLPAVSSCQGTAA